MGFGCNLPPFCRFNVQKLIDRQAMSTSPESHPAGCGSRQKRMGRSIVKMLAKGERLGPNGHTVASG